MARKISNWIRTWLENATTRIASSVPLVAVGAFAVAMVLRNAPFDVKEALVSDTDAMEIAVEAWLYGYPLITMDMTRRLMTNVTAPEGKQAPMGRWAKLRNFPPLLSRDIAAPNPDTLYTTAWIDLSRAPYILGIPNSKGRYYLMPILDAWTNVVASPGSRTTGTAAQRYIITGPNWTGSIPAGLKEYKSPTNLVWIVGRIYCSGTPEDYEKVHAFQEELSLLPATAIGPSYTPPPGAVDPEVDALTPIREQINRMDTGVYFNRLAELMKENPPSAADTPLLQRIAKLGIVPGRAFDLAKADPVISRALKEAPRSGFSKILAHCKQSSVEINGWGYFLKLGEYGTDYLHRAFTSAIGVGANLPQDAVYPVSELDADGRPYDGSHRYLLRFQPGAPPPVKGFWSLAIYDDQYCFVPNSMNRYTVSTWTPLHYNDDGSLDIYIQRDSPGANHESNWLPCPPGPFVLMLRLYWVKESEPTILTGSWHPPAVKRLD